MSDKRDTEPEWTMKCWGCLL